MAGATARPTAAMANAVVMAQALAMRVRVGVKVGVKVIVTAVVLALLAGACSSGAEPAAAPDPGQAGPTSDAAPTPAPGDGDPAELDEGSFCVNANAFVTATDVRLTTSPDAATFSEIDRRLSALVAIAPAVVIDDIDQLRTGFTAVGDAFAAVGYDPTATVSLPGDVLSANARAAVDLERYLIAECALADLMEHQTDAIALAFGIDDRTLATCVHTQLGDVANIEPSVLTPELMTTPVCDTTLLGLLSGEIEVETAE